MPNTISIAGNIGSGKSSVARRIAETTGLPFVSTGALFRELAARRGMTVLELNQRAETDRSIDDEVDGHLRRLSESGDSAVIDSRMAWHFVPRSFKVYLVVDPRVAVARVYGAVRADERYETVDEAADDVLARQQVEAERYLDLYGVHVDDWRNYDLVVDTSRAGIARVADLAVSQLREGGRETRPVCHLDPSRLIPATPERPSGPVRVAVVDGDGVVVTGHAIVRDALERGDALLESELAAFGPEEIASLADGAAVLRAFRERPRWDDV
ncbi:MAG TPA: cytidylate kinase family protein [Acidimicrobiia bacterium]|nr:cytidylate kinase family protein [Acidimicrobiia bacterium]